jgi:hypothetical protein
MRPGLVAVVCGAWMALGSGPALALSIDEIVARNIEAHGGAAALQAIKTLRLSGKIIVNGGQMELGFVQSFKRPGRLREEASLQGMTQVQAFDGKDGWQINPFGGRKDPERLSADDSKSLIESIEDIGSPLADWKANGAQVDYLGTEDIDGTMAHKVKLTRASGDITYIWLEPDHFLEIRTLSQRIEHGVQRAIETDMGDYEKVAGVYLPFAFETGRKGSSDKQKTVIEKAEANVALDDAQFVFPAKPAVVATPAAK